MFENFNQLAEAAASGVSRRQFLGRLGRGAMLAASAAAGLLAFCSDAETARQPRVCGAGSSASCLGANVGDTCYEEGAGTCQTATGKATDTACYCRVRLPKRRR
jgi:hypothetical protein